MLKLHHGYCIPGVKNRKLSIQRSIQRVGRFEIKRRVSPLAYEPELPPNMKIHPIISVTNLEPLPPGEDPYKRPFNNHPPPFEEEWKSFSIKRLLNRRLRRYGRGKKIIEYLYGEDLFDNAVQLMLEYETRQNNDPERIDYLRKQLAGENTELPADSAKPPAKNLGRKPNTKQIFKPRTTGPPS
ncbi:hypothetical protein V8E54_009010 [Elaphomyces granulatus]